MSKASEAQVVSNGETEATGRQDGLFERSGWCRWDFVALSVWTAAVAVFFWDSLSLRRALFYFDITEINYPYRAFFAEELRAGRFSRWCPGLYCGLPLFSESQAGYLHPLKYLLYPWMQTWQAFNLDTVLSIWVTGLATYGWLRRHVGSAAALTGAAVFGASGYVWGHLIHTSMINALASVPFVIWGLEASWTSRSLARRCFRRPCPGDSGLRRPPAGLAFDDRPRRPLRSLPRGHRAPSWPPACVRWAWRSSWLGWVS